MTQRFQNITNCNVFIMEKYFPINYKIKYQKDKTYAKKYEVIGVNETATICSQLKQKIDEVSEKIGQIHITGTLINLEDNSEDVRIGKVLHELGK